MKQKNKSDVKAKEAFCEELKRRGFDSVRIVQSPADIEARKDGQTWYFEIKKTAQEKSYFGAATQTEWEQAFENPEHFRFVVARTNEIESYFDFIEYTPEEFLEFSSIPPFKVFFNINFSNPKGKKKTNRKKTKSLEMTYKNFKKLSEFFKKLKEKPTL
jgi:hypothetical protein